MIYGVRGVTALGMLFGQVTAVGGVGMLISGILNYQQGSTFGATAFGMYGLFYISLGLTLYPEAGVAVAYPESHDYNQALGLYLLMWFLLSIIMWPVTWRLNVGLAVLCELSRKWQCSNFRFQSPSSGSTSCSSPSASSRATRPSPTSVPPSA